jgi:hypothetical protein
MLVQPWREFEGRGWLEVIYLGGSITRTVKCKLLSSSLILDGERELTEVFVGPQEAKDRIVKAKLWTPREKGKKSAGTSNEPQLPKKSLTKEDFKGTDGSLQARARSVASNLGERTAAGRIGSMALTRPGCDTFEKWWVGAGANRIARVLTDKKHYDTLEKADKARLVTLLEECPFRSNEPVPTPKEEEGESAEAEPTPSTKGKGKGKKERKEKPADAE